MQEDDKVVFEEPAAARLCSANRCRNGHEWPVQVAARPCGGCQSPVVLVKMAMCPVCNEPAVAVRLRTEHVPSGAKVVARCKGEQSGWEAIEVEMERKPMEEKLEGKEPA